MQEATVSPRAHPTADGRAARAERTMDSVVVAFLELVEEGDLRPSAQRVAKRAGVSLRSVFHHFADMESLFASAADLQMRRIAAAAAPMPPSLPLSERVAAFVTARTRVLEAISPVRRASVLAEPFSHEVQARLAQARDGMRGEVAHVFAPELSVCTPGERRELLAALAAVTEWPAWESLRAHQQLSLALARRVMTRTIAALLNEARR